MKNPTATPSVLRNPNPKTPLKILRLCNPGSKLCSTNDKSSRRRRKLLRSLRGSDAARI